MYTPEPDDIAYFLEDLSKKFKQYKHNGQPVIIQNWQLTAEEEFFVSGIEGELKDRKSKLNICDVCKRILPKYAERLWAYNSDEDNNRLIENYVYYLAEQALNLE